MHLRKRLTGPKYAIKIEDNEVDELKPKVFNLVVSFNMFNWKENSTKEYGEYSSAHSSACGQNIFFLQSQKYFFL